MPSVMIKCTKCGKEIPTGVATDAATFANATMTNNTTKCPHCGLVQSWSKKDAYLK